MNKSELSFQITILPVTAAAILSDVFPRAEVKSAVASSDPDTWRIGGGDQPEKSA